MFVRLALCLVAFYCVSATQEWHVSDQSITCTIVHADPVITVKFTNASFTIPLNNTASTDGNCTALFEKQAANTLSIKFRLTTSATALTDQLWILDLVFGSNTTVGAFQLVNYQLTTKKMDSMPGSEDRTFKMDPKATNDINAQKDDAYRCSSTVLNLENESKIDMKNLHALAMAKYTDTTFSKEQVFENCAADAQTSDIVPIIVGACLAGLVVIVLVAYLIGRARAKRQGYASV